MEDFQRPAPWGGQQNPKPAANDESLIEAVRNGDNEAFGELYTRHRGAVLAVARLHSNNHAEAEDITSEAFTRVLALLKTGGGPRQFLRAYLVTAVSRLAADRANDLNRTQPQEPQEQGKLDRIQLFDDTVVRQVDAAVVARAFASLPERWQEVLWYLEIEGYRPREVASVVGIQPNAVSALGKRARNGLRTAYMQQHVSAQALEECGEYSAQLGAFVRGTLTPSKMKLMQDHLDSCERCTAEYLQLQDLGVGLRGWILPILAGLPLWGDASERLLAALGTVGAGGAAGVSGLVSGTTTPLGAGAEVTSAPASAGAASVGPATPVASTASSGTTGAATSAASATSAGTATSAASTTAVSSAAGGVLAGSATKVILAAAGVAVAGAGTAGIIAAIQQDSSEVENTRQAQPATEDPAGSEPLGDIGDRLGAGGDSAADFKPDRANAAAGDTDASGENSSGYSAGGNPADGTSGGTGALLGQVSPSTDGQNVNGSEPRDALSGNGALLPYLSDRNLPADNPGRTDAPASRGAPDVPQLNIPLTPTLPGPILPVEPPAPEDSGPRNGPGTGLDVDGADGEFPEAPGAVEPSGPSSTPTPGNPASEEPGNGESDSEGPEPGEPGADNPGADDPGSPGRDDNDNDDPENPRDPGNGNNDPEGTGNTDPGGTGNTNPGGTGNTNPDETGNTNPGNQPTTPGRGTPVTPGAPSSPNNPPLAGPGTEPTGPAVDPDAEPPQPVPVPGEEIGERANDLMDDSQPVTGWWGTLPEGWVLSDWIIFIQIVIRP
ncbi:sigma-70 family RNA polymerase sigma factor [Kocuria atrinae]|uniref:RNA polymerase sigma-70 region 2 domain-containing protein n=1 Tax=Kocuria atrinae TaxID=592377 RepID=A0ABP5J3B5_9MICC